MRSRGKSQDEEHLRILSISFYVYAGLLALGGLVPFIYVAIGLAMLSGAMNGPGPNNGPPAVMGVLFVCIPSAISLFIWALAGCCVFTGMSLAKKRNYMFCFVIACLCCLQMGPIPIGIILGIFSIIVLARPGVKQLFEAGRAPSPAVEE